MIPSSACPPQAGRPGLAGVRAGTASYTTQWDTIVRSAGRRRTQVSGRRALKVAFGHLTGHYDPYEPGMHECHREVHSRSFTREA